MFRFHVKLCSSSFSVSWGEGEGFTFFAKMFENICQILYSLVIINLFLNIFLSASRKDFLCGFLA